MSRPAKPTTTPAAPVIDQDGAKLMAADTQNAAVMIGQLSVISAQFDGGLPYDRNRIVSEARFFLGQSAEAMLEAGKRLIILKEHESSHGEFTDIVENELGIAPQVARRMMQAAVKFLDPKRSTLSVLGKSKLYELMVLDDEELDVLAEGGTVFGLQQDEIERMSARELRAALRKERDGRKSDAETSEKMLAGKDKKINELDRRLSRIAPWPEQAAEINTDVAKWTDVATEAIGRLEQNRVAVSELLMRDDEFNRPEPRRALAEAEIAAINRLAEQVATLQAAVYDEYADLLAQPRYILQDAINIQPAETA